MCPISMAFTISSAEPQFGHGSPSALAADRNILPEKSLSGCHVVEVVIVSIGARVIMLRRPVNAFIGKHAHVFHAYRPERTRACPEPVHDLLLDVPALLRLPARPLSFVSLS
jgi:hypothetical protein